MADLEMNMTPTDPPALPTTSTQFRETLSGQDLHHVQVQDARLLRWFLESAIARRKWIFEGAVRRLELLLRSLR